MFPNPKHLPTGFFQEEGGFPVTKDISSDLVSPVPAVVARHSQVSGAAVPETAVHKDREASARKDKIGLADKSIVATPAGDAMRPENSGQPQFGGTVAGGPDRGHDLGSFLLGEHIGHA